MMPNSLISEAPKFFKTDDVKVYDVKTIFDNFGYKYLIKQQSKTITASVHFMQNFESNEFGRFNGTTIILSTMESLEIGSIVDIKNQLFAISHQRELNQKLNEFDFVCYSIYDYYNDFILEAPLQQDRILGANSMRFLLDTPLDIPIIPAMFSPKNDKYLSLSIYATQTRSTPYKNEDLYIEQQKKDFAELYAIGLDTNELQKVAYDLMFNPKGFALANFVSWEQVKRYDSNFDLKANIWKSSLEINYTITTTQKLNADKLIKNIAWNFNFN